MKAKIVDNVIVDLLARPLRGEELETGEWADIEDGFGIGDVYPPVEVDADAPDTQA